jgi:hypothetical protein
MFTLVHLLLIILLAFFSLIAKLANHYNLFFQLKIPRENDYSRGLANATENLPIPRFEKLSLVKSTA